MKTIDLIKRTDILFLVCTGLEKVFFKGGNALQFQIGDMMNFVPNESTWKMRFSDAE